MRQIFLPRTHRLAILSGEDANHLADVAEVVYHPGRYQLAEGDGAEPRMLAFPIEIRG